MPSWSFVQDMVKPTRGHIQLNIHNMNTVNWLSIDCFLWSVLQTAVCLFIFICNIWTLKLILTLKKKRTRTSGNTKHNRQNNRTLPSPHVYNIKGKQQQRIHCLDNLIWYRHIQCWEKNQIDLHSHNLPPLYSSRPYFIDLNTQ